MNRKLEVIETKDSFEMKVVKCEDSPLNVNHTKFLKVASFMELDEFKCQQRLSGSMFLLPYETKYLISVSYKWSSEQTPDSDGLTFRMIKQFIVENNLQNVMGAGLFIDYFCLPQNDPINHIMRTDTENSIFRLCLNEANLIYSLSDVVIICNSTRYYNSSWCRFEYVISSIMKNCKVVGETLPRVSYIVGSSRTRTEMFCSKILLDTHATNGDDVIKLEKMLMSFLTTTLQLTDKIRGVNRDQVELIKNEVIKTYPVISCCEVVKVTSGDQDQFKIDYNSLHPTLCGILSLILLVPPFSCCCCICDNPGIKNINLCFKDVESLGYKYNGDHCLTIDGPCFSLDMDTDIISSFIVDTSKLEETTLFEINKVYGGLDNLLRTSKSGVIDKEIHDKLVAVGGISFEDYKFKRVNKRQVMI